MSNLQLTGHSGQVLTALYNNSTTLLASSGMDKTIFLWDCKNSYNNIANLKSHRNAITSLTWSNIDRLISGSADKCISNWDVESGKIIRKYRGHSSIVHDVSCPKKTRDLIASVSDDGALRIWEQRCKEQIRVCQTKYPLTSVCLNYDGDKVYFGGLDSQIKCYNIAQSTIEEVISGHQDIVSSLQISHDGAYLMSNSFDQTLRIWSTKNSQVNKRLLKTMSGHSQGTQKTLIRSAWSRDGLYVACGSIDKCAYIWDASTRKIAQRLGGHIGTVTQVTMGDNNMMASASNDRTIMVSELPDIFL